MELRKQSEGSDNKNGGIFMKLFFQNVDEVNAYLLKDTKPYDYCISIVKALIEHVREYLNGEHDTPDAYFDELPLESVVLPDPKEIEYVNFYNCFPMIATKEQAEALGISANSVAKSNRYLFFNLRNMMCDGNKWNDSYGFDSRQGAYFVQDKDRRNQQPDGSYRILTRGWRDYSVQFGVEVSTYWTDSLDAYIGALIAEQILLSNEPEARSLTYGNLEYVSRAVTVFPFSKNDNEIYSRQFMNEAYSYCCKMVHINSLAYHHGCSSDDDKRRVNRTAFFIYYYLHSLKHFSVAENFSIIEPIVLRWLDTFYWSWTNKYDLIHQIQAVCHADYYTRPELKLETPLEHMQAAVWALTNSKSYMEAMRNILEYVDYQHRGRLAVTLTGAFAGIYYQHYRIPRKYMTENRYYSRYSLHILPLDNTVYDKYDQQTT